MIILEQTVTTIECTDIKITPMGFRFLILIGAFLFCRFYKAITIYFGMYFLFAFFIIHSPAEAK